MRLSPLLEALIEALRCLPSIGPKSSQRIAFHLLQRNPSGAAHLAHMLTRALAEIKQCVDCRSFTEYQRCSICVNVQRTQNGQLCVVESPADVHAIEQTGQFSGRYFVLMGSLSPLDGIGPHEIGLDLLEARLLNETFTEVILATNPTVEGEVTAQYIANICKQYNLPASRIAHGVPIGGELDMVDSNTLSHAFIGRNKITF